MRVDVDSLPCAGLPEFLEEARTLRTALGGMPEHALQALWKCNGSTWTGCGKWNWSGT